MIFTEVIFMPVEKIQRETAEQYEVDLPFSVVQFIEFSVRDEKVIAQCLIENSENSKLIFGILPANLEVKILTDYKIIGSFKIEVENEIRNFLVIQIFKLETNQKLGLFA